MPASKNEGGLVGAFSLEYQSETLKSHKAIRHMSSSHMSSWPNQLSPPGVMRQRTLGSASGLQNDFVDVCMPAN